MTSPTVSSGNDQPESSVPDEVHEWPLFMRRCGAWAVEMSLIVASSVVPFTIGAMVNKDTQLVPLNPVVTTTTDTIAQTLGIPVRDRNPKVAPLTNLLWSIGILAPIAVGGWQLYLLGKRGQTLPKKWFDVKVTDANGAPPGIPRILLREGLGRWGIPLGIAYGIWRITGAFPDLIILAGLGTIALTTDVALSRFDPKRRTGHDFIGRTVVIDGKESFVNPFMGENWTEEDNAIAAIVVSPEEEPEYRGLWGWMRQYPGMTLLIVTGGGMFAVLGTFIGTQIYIQSQTNLRDFKQRDDQIFLALVGKLSSGSPNAIGERRGAILALGTVKDSRATPYLKDLLAQEDNPALLDTIQQALVSRGISALPHLQQLNQSISNDLDSMRFGGSNRDKEIASLRLRATQRAIAKILTVYSGGLNNVDLSRTDLSQTGAGAAQFTLVLNNTDVSGIRFKNSKLMNASLEGTRFASVGEDKRFGTFDDWLSDFTGANLEGANLNSAFLSNVPMSRVNLVRATLNKANLAGANLTSANLGSARLIQANLKQASLKDASLTGADLGSANLSGVNLEGARLAQVKAQGAQLSLSNLGKTDWQGSDLSGVDFSSANLQKANLSGTRLANANLSNTLLQEANLQNADLSLVDWRGANVKGANFKGANLLPRKSSQPDQFIQKSTSTGKTGRLVGVDFTDAKNLDSSQIAYICLQGGIHPRCPQKN